MYMKAPKTICNLDHVVQIFVNKKNKTKQNEWEA